MNIRHLIRNICITVFHSFGVSFIYRTWLRKEGPLVRIVVFHDVKEEEWFDSLMRTLKEHYHLLTPEAFAQKQFQKEKINVLVTFDDGYASWQHLVAPVLMKHDIKALFFINSGLLDMGGDTEHTNAFMREQLMVSPRAPLTWSAATALLEEGHSIGSHAQHHVNLAKLPPDEVKKELEADKSRIESALGVMVTECAYPFGTRHYVSETVEKVAHAVGFKRGYTAVSRFVREGDMYAIPRMCIEDTAMPRTIKMWVEGSYDLFDMIKTVCVR
jgi:peptidoglycan/xylan/chitin deacetylase (PgdA/CDA1 family)